MALARLLKGGQWLLLCC